MTTAYVGDLGSGQQIYVENLGEQTTVALNQSSAGQQQSQKHSFNTGQWHLPPMLSRTALGWVLQLEAEQGRFFVQLQTGQIQVSTQPPASTSAEVQPLRPVEQEATVRSVEPMQPMQPMQPLKMGNMEMQMNPMQMRMGNMELRMGDSQKTDRHFCTQCGHAVAQGDRFCAQCGHRLES